MPLKWRPLILVFNQLLNMKSIHQLQKNKSLSYNFLTISPLKISKYINQGIKRLNFNNKSRNLASI